MTATWRPAAALAALRLRAGLVDRTREFFRDRGLLEVQTPALSAAGTTDPMIDSLWTCPRLAGGGPRYLHTSPEFPMKRLLAAGSGDIWQMCRVFRDGESGSRHNPEFTMVEWYRVGWDHLRLAHETLDLIATVLEGHKTLGPARTRSYRELFRECAGVDPFKDDRPALLAALQRHGVQAPPGDLTRDCCLDLLMGTVVASALSGSPGCPVVVVDYPASQAALARVAPGPPPVAERFEIFIDGMEIANGFHELDDPEEQRRRFEADRAARKAAGQDLVPLDERLLAALGEGLPPCAGVALGFDRLVMLAAGTRRIADVLAFPFDIA